MVSVAIARPVEHTKDWIHVATVHLHGPTSAIPLGGSPVSKMCQGILTASGEHHVIDVARAAIYRPGTSVH